MTAKKVSETRGCRSEKKLTAKGAYLIVPLGDICDDDIYGYETWIGDQEDIEELVAVDGLTPIVYSFDDCKWYQVETPPLSFKEIK